MKQPSYDKVHTKRIAMEDDLAALTAKASALGKNSWNVQNVNQHQRGPNWPEQKRLALEAYQEASANRLPLEKAVGALVSLESHLRELLSLDDWLRKAFNDEVPTASDLRAKLDKLALDRIILVDTARHAETARDHAVRVADGLVAPRHELWPDGVRPVQGDRPLQVRRRNRLDHALERARLARDDAEAEYVQLIEALRMLGERDEVEREKVEVERQMHDLIQQVNSSKNLWGLLK